LRIHFSLAGIRYLPELQLLIQQLIHTEQATKINLARVDLVCANGLKSDHLKRKLNPDFEK
jgi:hypothetical protein